MRRPRLRMATIIFLVAAVIALVAFGIGQWGSFRDLWVEAAGYAWEVGPAWLAAALVLGVCALAGTARVWAWLFIQAGGRARGREAMVAWLGSSLGRYLPGKLWHLTGLAAYLRARGGSGGVGIATSVALQAVTLLTGIAFGIAVAGSALSEAFGPWRLLLLVALFLLLAQPRAIRALTRVGGRFLREPDAGTVRLPARVLGGAALWMVVVWIVTGLGFWSLLRGLIGSTGPSPFGATGIYAASYVVGFLVLVAPGGLVVREGMMTGLIVSLVGTPVSVAAAIAVVARMWSTLVELIAFGIIAGTGAPVLHRARQGGAIEHHEGSEGRPEE